jgi:hypothetical protein
MGPIWVRLGVFPQLDAGEPRENGVQVLKRKKILWLAALLFVAGLGWWSSRPKTVLRHEGRTLAEWLEQNYDWGETNCWQCHDVREALKAMGPAVFPPLFEWLQAEDSRFVTNVLDIINRTFGLSVDLGNAE